LQTTAKKEDQASTSSGITKAPAAADAPEAGDGDDDLNLAWEMAEMARLTLYQVAETDETISPEDFAEVHEILADISSEREGFADAVTDYQQVLPISCNMAKCVCSQSVLPAMLEVHVEMWTSLHPGRLQL
jgi:hypothetical protein